MEGVASEAASLAGHLGLGKLIYLYDDNRISIDGSTDLAFTEDRGKRFEAYGWQVLRVADGNNVEEIDAAIQQAKKDPRPSLIICRTIIGYGMPNRQGTSKAHGEPPGDAELNAAKENLGWPIEPRFLVPQDVLDFFRQAVSRGEKLESDWNARLKKFKRAFPVEAREFIRRLEGKLPKGWDRDLPEFAPDAKGVATRAASGKIINALAERLPELMGGSADLAPSTNTWIQGTPPFEKDTPGGRNFHFGVREHAMGSIVNGMAIHGGVIPYGATFLVFSDYMRPAIRLSALSGFGSIWVFTHDSIGLGEDGPTHQPVEHLAALRAIPHLVVIRPADANETREAWKVAVQRRSGPTLMAFSRQAIPVIDRNKYGDAAGTIKGAYILADLGEGKPQIILMATGSEVSLILDAAERLHAGGVNVRVVSFPSWELFEMQPASYQRKVLPPGVKNRIAIEAGVTLGWERWVGAKGKVIGIDHYGASAPYKTIYEKFGLTVETIILEARKMLGEKE